MITDMQPEGLFVPMSTQRVPGQDDARADEVERGLLAALYLFPGGASFGTLARASGPLGWRQVEVAEALARLVAGSLVTLRALDGTARYEILGGARASLCGEQWAQDRLGEAARRHLAWCQDLVAEAEEALSCGPGQRAWLERLALEEANLSAGLGFALRSGDIAAAARLASGLCGFWELRGQLQEAATLISRVLCSGPLAAGARARLLDGFGRLALRQGHYEAARHAFEQALGAATAEGAPLALARARAHLGLAELCLGCPDLARSAVAQALAELDQLDSPADLARGYSTRALVALEDGCSGDALADLDRSTDLQVGTGDLAGWATSLLYRSLAQLLRKDADGAVRDARQAARLFLELGDQGSTAACLLVVAGALGAGCPASALELAGLAQRLQQASGAAPVPALRRMAETALAGARRAAGGQAGQLLRRGAALSPLEALARASGRGLFGDDGPWACVQVLGSFQVLRGGAAVRLAPQVARLVKLVVVSGGQVHVEQAVESLWPEVAPALGKRRLRNVLSKLSQAAGPLVVREGGTLRLGPGVAADVQRFQSAARQAIGALAGGGGGTGIAKALAAHDLYSGEVLPEDRYEDFAIVARERLNWLHLRLLDATAAAAADASDDATAEHCLRAALDIDPTDEGRYVALARHLIGSGRQSAASQVLSRARGLLARLGFPVSPALIQLEQVLRAPVRGR